MNKKRKNLLIKIGALLSVVAFAFTCVMVKPKAYTYFSPNNVVYSNNALPFTHPEKIVSSNDTPVQFADMASYDESYYIFTYSENYYYSAFEISLYSGESDSDYVTQLFGNTDLNSFYTAIPVSLFNGKSLNYCKANYSNYRIRFLVRSVGQGLPYQYAYLQFNCGAIFDYWLQFMDGDTIHTNYVLTEAFSARYSTQDLTHFYLFSKCGIYCGGSSSIDQNKLDYYGENGEYCNLWNNTIIESYQNANLQLEQDNSVLRRQIELLNQQLSNTLGWKPLFFAMADTPFKVVKSFLGFEVLGVDLFGAFVGFLTLLAIIWLIKKII